MKEFKRPRHRSLIDEAIERKGEAYAETSKSTFRSDSMAILESLVAEADEEAVMAALVRQGFRESTSYRTTLRALAEVARSRRRG